MKPKSLEYVLKRQLRACSKRKFHQASCIDKALMAGHGIQGYKALWYREGDGKKFGCINDNYFAQACYHAGYTAVRIR